MNFLKAILQAVQNRECRLHKRPKKGPKNRKQLKSPKPIY